MTDAHYDTFAGGIGITTLAQDAPVDEIQTASPIAINGVAIPEDTVLEGGQGVRHYYPPTMARRAAEVLQQQLDDEDQRVHIVKNFHELEGQASADDIIGEVTGVGYSKGVGVVFEGEITDQDTAEKIALGYLDISPTVARALGGEMDEQMEARAVTDIAGFRDIAVVGQGQPGAGVEVGNNPSIEALARDVLLGSGNGDGDGDGDGDGEGDGDGGTEPETMSLDDAKETLAEEYGIDTETLEERLTDDGQGEGDGEGDGADDGSDLPEDVVVLVEAGEAE